MADRRLEENDYQRLHQDGQGSGSQSTDHQSRSGSRGRGFGQAGRDCFGQANLGQPGYGRGNGGLAGYAQWQQRPMQQFDNDYTEYRQQQQDEFDCKSNQCRQSRTNSLRSGSSEKASISSSSGPGKSRWNSG